MKPEGSMWCLQGPTNSPSPESREFNPHLFILSKFQYYTLLPSRHRSSKWFPPFRSPYQNFLCNFHVSQACYTSRPYYPL